MKIPQAFVPEKNLDKKTEEIKEYKIKELSLEEFMKNNTGILYGETTEDKREEILRNAVDKIVNDTFQNKINWEKDTNNYPNTSESYKAKAIILNYKGEKITIPVWFQIDDVPIFKWGYLYLGGREADKGLCITTHNKKVKELAVKYFKIKTCEIV